MVADAWSITASAPQAMPSMRNQTISPPYEAEKSHRR
jgi:hypothetical protein